MMPMPERQHLFLFSSAETLTSNTILYLSFLPKIQTQKTVKDTRHKKKTENNFCWGSVSVKSQFVINSGMSAVFLELVTGVEMFKVLMKLENGLA